MSAKKSQYLKQLEDLGNNTDSIEESDEKSEDNNKVSKEFQEMVIKFVKLDDAVRNKQDELVELKKQRKPCEEYILKYMDSLDAGMIHITNGKLRKNKSETKKALSIDIIRKAIETKVKNKSDIEAIMNYMEESRPLNINVNLKRTREREKRKKNKD